jgi:hypothetical protein
MMGRKTENAWPGTDAAMLAGRMTPKTMYQMENEYDPGNTRCRVYPRLRISPLTELPVLERLLDVRHGDTNRDVVLTT